MAEVFLFIAEGTEEAEAIVIYDLLKRAEIDVAYVSVADKLEITAAHGTKLLADYLIDEISLEKTKALVLPGGMPGTYNLRDSETLADLGKNFLSEPSRYLAAICAAPLVLASWGVLAGKTATVYPGFEEELTAQVEVVDELVVQDGQIITGKSLGAAFDFALLLIENLRDEETAQQVAAEIYYE